MHRLWRKFMAAAEPAYKIGRLCLPVAKTLGESEQFLVARWLHRKGKLDIAW